VRRPAFVVSVASIVAVFLAGQALAVVVVRHDTDDFEIAPDVHTTAKRVFESTEGGWRVRISASGDLGPDYRLKALLDTRSGPRADVEMVANVSNLELISCSVRRIGGGGIDANCEADGFRAWWVVARSDLHRTKVIRWVIIARKTPAFGGAVTDRAPDHGWYP
jgi:hypothetical protein